MQHAISKTASPLSDWMQQLTRSATMKRPGNWQLPKPSCFNPFSKPGLRPPESYNLFSRSGSCLVWKRLFPEHHAPCMALGQTMSSAESATGLVRRQPLLFQLGIGAARLLQMEPLVHVLLDRKSTRLNSSHVS